MKDVKKRTSRMAAKILPKVALTLCTTLMMVASVSAATDLEATMKSVFNEIYTTILALSTGAMVVVVATALFISFFSKRQKVVDECHDWAKRAVITWVIINALSLGVSFLQTNFKQDQLDLTTASIEQSDESVTYAENEMVIDNYTYLL